jgi:hypothetical protein
MTEPDIHDDAHDDARLREAVAHVLAHGEVGKQSRERLRTALQEDIDDRGRHD